MADPQQENRAEETLHAEYRRLPAVDALLREPAIAALTACYGQELVTETLRELLAKARQAIGQGRPAPPPTAWPGLLEQALRQAHAPTLRPVINATGVIIHTNLGRAPLSQAARQAVDEISLGYSNLEYELDAGQRGSRYDHVRERLRRLTQAEDALVVNNNAAAVYLVLAALCQGREVLISRGQLVEIGGGFRIPDVLRQSGARLVEVGTTNRTHLRDYREALTPETAAIMRVHTSNFRQLGFVAQPALADLAALAREYAEAQGRPLWLIDDLGSGTLLDTTPYGLAPEPRVQESLAAGADLVTFSGDKLLGGPQAGIIVGRGELIGRLRRHPMARALRVDKMTLAALDATLRSYQQGRAQAEIPVWRMIAASLEALRARAQGWRQALLDWGVPPALLSLRDDESAVGGGSLPGETLPTVVLAVHADQPSQMAARLRAREVPVICRIQQEQLLFDPRTVLPEQDPVLLDTLREALVDGAETGHAQG
ncbi:L-seryl-tRNA(Sec) selenium transferase [Litorilinea aerophila]|uniref:L-seryl-tRNA(Sec) selenium transferase n=1 Tax=Litorilinea aerophila TaxID=1204385 RepID=A0A540VIS1_9CHLR|nr:L-seryl-tRNA(Sec) selenium transferase [Litorilinea aerophila]MCC9075880.1 L-seryl-tRNA(Sec) selenium transferase [Litorilinea aerophila]GIV77189.1 MAG: L-seryl-tRNA(Sec) selenium transferase [Litorilinea sp.]